jgi:hypothetical protein
VNMPPALLLTGKQIAIAIALWLVGGTSIGFTIATVIGEHGSIIWAILGFAIGLAGAIAHATLLFLPSFRRQSRTRQTISLWFVTVFSLAAIVAAYYLFSDSELNYSPKEIALFLFIYVAVPTLLAAAVASYVVARRPAA